MAIKEKIALKQLRDNSYKVVSLENRIEPAIGSILKTAAINDLLMEAKVKKVLTVKIS